MNYTAKGTHNRHFELFDANDAALGKLDYTSWFTIKSTIELNGGKSFEIAPANIWHTSIDITANDVMIGSMKFSWKGQIIVTLENGKTYYFKRIGFFNSHYALLNEQDHELIKLDQQFILSKLTFNYFLETDDNYAEANDPLLVLLTIYCANYMHNRHTA
jgi:hypothetical protein